MLPQPLTTSWLAVAVAVVAALVVVVVQVGFKRVQPL
jgi:hypothetical protein